MNLFYHSIVHASLYHGIVIDEVVVLLLQDSDLLLTDNHVLCWKSNPSQPSGEVSKLNPYVYKFWVDGSRVLTAAESLVKYNK